MPLYHFTTLENLTSILKSNCLVGNKRNYLTLRNTLITPISLTKNKKLNEDVRFFSNRDVRLEFRKDFVLQNKKSFHKVDYEGEKYLESQYTKTIFRYLFANDIPESNLTEVEDKILDYFISKSEYAKEIAIKNIQGIITSFSKEEEIIFLKDSIPISNIKKISINVDNSKLKSEDYLEVVDLINCYNYENTDFNIEVENLFEKVM